MKISQLISSVIGTGCLLAALTQGVSAADAAAPAAPAAAPAKPTPAPAAPVAKTNHWESSVAAGLTLTKGNSDTVLGTLNFLTKKNWEQNELRFGADGTYGENSSVKNNESAHAFGQYNRLFTQDFYGYFRADGLHDGIAKVEYRVTLSPGAGYYIIKNDRTRLSAEVGPGVVFEKQGHKELTYMTLRVAERFEHKLNDRAKIWESVEFLPQVDRFTNYIVNSEIGVETALTKSFSLRVFLVDNYDNEPALGRKKNDIKLVSAVAYTF